MTGPRPRPGRPRDPHKVEAIIDAGWRLFLAQGVEAVSVETIAAAAGVAKATVYAHFTDKRALFHAGVRREIAKIEAAQALHRADFGAATLSEVLIRFGIGLVSFWASPTAIDFYARLAGELRSDAELAALFYAAGPGKTLANLTAILSSPLAAELMIDEPEAAAENLIGQWQGMSNYRAMLAIGPAPTPGTIAAHVEATVARFLKAYR